MWLRILHFGFRLDKGLRSTSTLHLQDEKKWHRVGNLSRYGSPNIPKLNALLSSSMQDDFIGIAKTIKLCHVGKKEYIFVPTNTFLSRKSSIEELKIFSKQPWNNCVSHTQSSQFFHWKQNSLLNYWIFILGEPTETTFVTLKSLGEYKMVKSVF